jgi:hypothetical protein
VCKVYLAWWNADPRSWHLVVVLLYLSDGNWREVGMAGYISTSGLRIPPCFEQARVTTESGEEASVLSWAERLQDGELQDRGPVSDLFP